MKFNGRDKYNSAKIKGKEYSPLQFLESIKNKKFNDFIFIDYFMYSDGDMELSNIWAINLQKLIYLNIDNNYDNLKNSILFKGERNREDKIMVFDKNEIDGPNNLIFQDRGMFFYTKGINHSIIF